MDDSVIDQIRKVFSDMGNYTPISDEICDCCIPTFVDRELKIQRNDKLTRIVLQIPGELILAFASQVFVLSWEHTLKWIGEHHGVLHVMAGSELRTLEYCSSISPKGTKIIVDRLSEDLRFNLGYTPCEFRLITNQDRFTLECTLNMYLARVELYVQEGENEWPRNTVCFIECSNPKGFIRRGVSEFLVVVGGHPIYSPTKNIGVVTIHALPVYEEYSIEQVKEVTGPLDWFLKEFN